MTAPTRLVARCLLGQALLEEMCIPLNRHQLKKLMMDIDTDGSGEVDFDEARHKKLRLLERGYDSIEMFVLYRQGCTRAGRFVVTAVVRVCFS